MMNQQHSSLFTFLSKLHKFVQGKQKRNAFGFNLRLELIEMVKTVNAILAIKYLISKKIVVLKISRLNF